ncbi:hypothetical protein [Leptospira santarosai]|uniref:hypothetical protein n=1 Tax=Leptospira santarosai TaxID=28183 RepID=UPI00036A693A|nr:hypothetical protein [Leptospira santarosai]
MKETVSENLILEMCRDIENVIKDTSGKALTIEPKTKLIQDGILDSVALVGLLLFLQTKHDLSIDVTYMNEIHFATPGTIVNLISELK